MAEDVVIRAEGLGKKYVIGHQAQRESYVALRDVIARNVRNLGRTAMDVVRGRPTIAGDDLEEFWALRDVDFEIRRGEVVGVIGRNGAGKSTLLKVLSRITEPTTGRVEIRGRIASLLEVGTGFHPELTGRENIYLNGAILGMSHAEIRRKFDEIVAFAEVERFLDTPVKRYSSGMYVRLAFAVAAHLEPEILIVDEVLAVGDAEFQKKCLGKMGEVAGHGRTVLFVSHNMAAVQTLCPRSILMAGGAPVFDGPSSQAISRHLSQRRTSETREIEIDAGLFLCDTTIGPEAASAQEAVTIGFDLRIARANRLMELAVIISSPQGERVGVVDAREFGVVPCELTPGLASLTLSLPTLPLVEGEYTVGLHVRTRHCEAELLELADLRIHPTPDTFDFVRVAPEWRGVIELAHLSPSMVIQPKKASDVA